MLQHYFIIWLDSSKFNLNTSFFILEQNIKKLKNHFQKVENCLWFNSKKIYKHHQLDLFLFYHWKERFILKKKIQGGPSFKRKSSPGDYKLKDLCFFFTYNHLTSLLKLPNEKFYHSINLIKSFFFPFIFSWTFAMANAWLVYYP